MTTYKVPREFMPQCLRRRTVACIIALAIVGVLCTSQALAADSPPMASDYARETAERDLKQAHLAVLKCRATVDSARARLDEFVGRHFHDQQAIEPLTLPPWRWPEPAATAADPEIQQLLQQLRPLEVRRQERLGRLTPAHPEVMELDLRISQLTHDLAARGVQVEPGEAPKISRDPSITGSESDLAATAERINEHLLAQQERSQRAEAEYNHLWKHWQNALEDFRAALETENQAALQVAALHSSVKRPVEAKTLPPAVVLTPRSPEIRPTSRTSSQPIAIAALVIALAIAAWAAIRLSRSTGDDHFASIEDVGAALALPVVGIVSSARTLAVPIANSRTISRAWVVLFQVLLAVAVFGLIAMFVQSPRLFN